MSASVTETAASLALKEPSPRTRTIVENAHPFGAVRQTLEHAVEPVDHGICGERRDTDRAQRGRLPPRLSDLADVAWPDETGAQVGLVDEDPDRGIALGERIQFLKELDDRFGLGATGQLHEHDPIFARVFSIDPVHRHLEETVVLHAAPDVSKPPRRPRRRAEYRYPRLSGPARDRTWDQQIMSPPLYH